MASIQGQGHDKGKIAEPQMELDIESTMAERLQQTLEETKKDAAKRGLQLKMPGDKDEDVLTAMEYLKKRNTDLECKNKELREKRGQAVLAQKIIDVIKSGSEGQPPRIQVDPSMDTTLEPAFLLDEEDPESLLKLVRGYETLLPAAHTTDQKT